MYSRVLADVKIINLNLIFTTKREVRTENDRLGGSQVIDTLFDINVVSSTPRHRQKSNFCDDLYIRFTYE
jgi:hypothetical protein